MSKNVDEFWDDTNDDFFEEDEIKVEEPKVEKVEEVAEEDFEEEAQEEVKTEESPTKVLASTLAQAGLLPESDDEADLDTIIEALLLNTEETIERGIEETIESWKEDLGEKGVEFAKFVRAGGKPEEYFKAYAHDTLQFDVNSERGQEAFLAWYYKKHDDMDAEDIEDKLLTLKDREQLAAKAQNLYAKLRAKQDKEAEAFATKQIEAARKAKEAQQKERNRLIQGIQSVETLNGEKLPKLERTALLSFIAKDSEEFEGQRTTGLTKALNEAFSDPKTLLKLAKWAKLGFPDFTPKESSAKQKQTKNFNPKPARKSLVDFF